MDLVITVVIGIFGVVFLAAAIGLIVVLIMRYGLCKKIDHISRQHNETRPDAQLIVESPDPLSGIDSPVHVELGAVQISNPKLEELLDSDQWFEDNFGMVPHCLSILKICHQLTEKLVNIGCSFHRRSPERLIQMVTVAKQISQNVDDVIDSIQPPLDPWVLEARFTALVMSVSQLVMVTKNICRMSGKLDWIDQSMLQVEDHLRVLHEARVAVEEQVQGIPTNNIQSGVTQGQPHVQISPTERNDMSQV